MNEATSHGLTPVPRAVGAEWFAFDNTTGESRPLGRTTGAGERLHAPDDLPSTPGTFVRVDLTAEEPGHPTWAQPVRAYFKRDASGWKLVGFERIPSDGD